jgi:O-antigen/teichoic acid export membrane protein
MSLNSPSPAFQGGKSRESTQFVSDMIWVAAAQLMNTLVMGFISFPFLTKSYSSETYGIWNQINLTVTLLSIILTLQLGIALVRFLAGEDTKYNKSRAVGSMLSVIMLLCGLTIILALVFSPQISTLLFADSSYVFFVRLTLLWLLTNSLFAFLGSYLRARNKIKLWSTLQLFYSLISVMLIIILTKVGFQLEWIIISIIATQAVFDLILGILIISDIGIPILNLKGLKSYLAFCLPQIPSTILLWIINFSDRYLITHLLSLSKAGIYTPSFNVASLTSLLYTPIGFVLLPLVTRLWEDGRTQEARSYIEYSSKLFLTLAIPAALGLAIISQKVLMFLATEEFMAGRLLVFLLAMGLVFQGVYYIHVNAVYLLKKTQIIPLMVVVAAIISVGLNLILIPRMGLLGAAISDIAAYSVLATMMTIWAVRAIGLRLNFRYLLKVTLATLVMTAAIYFVPLNGFLSILLVIVGGTCVFILSLWIFKAFSKEDQKMMKNIFSGLITRRNNAA